MAEHTKDDIAWLEKQMWLASQRGQEEPQQHIPRILLAVNALAGLNPAAVASLIEAAEKLRDDLLMRAEIDREGVAVVAAGNGVWFRFNEALAAIREPQHG